VNVKNPKSEIRNPKEGRRPKAEVAADILSHPMGDERNGAHGVTRPTRHGRVSSFGFLSDFELRISDFLPG
jgi:hypothetical protein